MDNILEDIVLSIQTVNVDKNVRHSLVSVSLFFSTQFSHQIVGQSWVIHSSMGGWTFLKKNFNKGRDRKKGWDGVIRGGGDEENSQNFFNFFKENPNF